MRARHGPVAWKNAGPACGFRTGPPAFPEALPLGAFCGTLARTGHGTGKNTGPVVGGGGGTTVTFGMSDAIATPVRTSDTTSPAGDWMLEASGGPDVAAEIARTAPEANAVVLVEK